MRRFLSYAPLEGKGNLDESEKLYREVVSMVPMLSPDNPAVKGSLEAVMRIAGKQGRLTQEALAIYQALPESAHLARAEVIVSWTTELLREKKLDDAEKLFTETFALNAESRLESAAFLKAVGRVFAGQGEWKKAAEAYTRAIEITPDDVSLWHRLAPVLVQSGELDAYREH